ncbi:hypothetical protein C8Q79DRAFT_185320 [Trametes meyenii]|nr:hypothetical protein C8Q79DRAFT_185320 [Trametes meyenii]
MASGPSRYTSWESTRDSPFTAQSIRWWRRKHAPPLQTTLAVSAAHCDQAAIFSPVTTLLGRPCDAG